MTATIMQALDTTIANVALPYMQGSLSASLDQLNWVLTSYIVRRRHHDRAGRLACRPFRPQGGVHRLRCRLHARLVPMRAGAEHRANGAVPPAARHGGAALVPLSQSVLLDAYSLEERGQAMAMWGVGVIAGSNHGSDHRRLADR